MAEISPAQSTEVEDRVAFRLARHARIFGDDGPESVHAVVVEHALRLIVGDREVMREQLRHLLALSEQHKRLDLRVLTTDAFAHAGRGGGFSLFDFGGRGRPVAFASVVHGPSVHLDGDSDITVMSALFEQACRSSLGPEDTRIMIEKALREL